MTLLERLERAAEGSRELDAEIAWQIELLPRKNWRGKVDYRQSVQACDEFEPESNWVVQRFTTSIDAALALIELKLPGCTVHTCTGPRMCTAVIFAAEDDDATARASAQTMPVALALALLRALEAPAQSNPENV